MAFLLDREAQGVNDQINARMQGVNGTLYSEGDALILGTTAGTNSGLLIQASAQTSQPQWIFRAMVTPPQQLRPAVFNQPDSFYEYLEVIDVAGQNLVMQTQFPAATFDGVACNTNALTNTVVFTGAGSTNDFTGGQVYINELGQQRTVINDTVSTGVHTLTVAPAFTSAPTVGNTLRVVPWGPGYNTGVKLAATNPQQTISVAVADKTGGHVLIFDVDLSKRTAYVRFSALNP